MSITRKCDALAFPRTASAHIGSGINAAAIINSTVDFDALHLARFLFSRSIAHSGQRISREVASEKSPLAPKPRNRALTRRSEVSRVLVFERSRRRGREIQPVIHRIRASADRVARSRISWVELKPRTYSLVAISPTSRKRVRMLRKKMNRVVRTACPCVARLR